MPLAAALRYDRKNSDPAVHACLLQSLTSGTPVSAASQAAGLSLAIRYPPPGHDTGEIDELAGLLALVLADRITAASGPAVSVSGMRDAVQALEAAGCAGSERHLLTALHSSSFQVRLTVALALIRRGTWGLITYSVDAWITGAECEADGPGSVASPLGLALWFCPHLASVDVSGRGDELYARGLALAAREDSNPLMFEISLARGFKLAAWARPDLPVDGRAVGLLGEGLRLWYSRVCVIHAIGIRLATPVGRDATADAGLLEAALDAIVVAEVGDRHPLVREAARITRSALVAGVEVARFCWLAESDMGRSNYQLDDEAMRLLGDVSLQLNLTYCAEPWSQTEWRMLGTTDLLPACIRQPGHREQYMTSGCPRECPFGLCPYPSPARRPRGRVSCRRRSARRSMMWPSGPARGPGTRDGPGRPR
jgi:hypothetical protein